MALTQAEWRERIRKVRRLLAMNPGYIETRTEAESLINDLCAALTALRRPAPYVIAGTKALGDELDALLDKFLEADEAVTRVAIKRQIQQLLWDNKMTFIRLMQGEIATDAAEPKEPLIAERREPS